MNAIVMKEEEATEAAEGSYMDKLGSSGEGFDGDFLCFNPPYFFSPTTTTTTTTTTCSPYSSTLLQSWDGQPHYLQEDAFLFHGVHVTQKSSPSPTAECSSSLSSMSSSPTSLTTATVSRSKTISKKTSTGGKKTAAAITTGSTTLPSAKKPRIGGTTNSTTTSRGTIRVRKEKLGERILALQQLVSPFGKSDTASVLHEALGYIRFLHDQVQVLSSPYLQRLPPSAHMQQELRPGEQQMPSDLRSRGLCLVPISCTEHVAGTNGADMWSPAAEKMNSSSSSSYSFPASSKH